MSLLLPPIYPITDKKLAGKSSHLMIVRELVRGGATLIQIRDKETPTRILLADLQRCTEFAAVNGVKLIVNDRCDLALLSGADGVHLGEKDLPPEAARTLLGRSAVIGLSAHTLAEVGRAQGLPVDYIGLGPVFATSTKPDAAPVVGMEGLRLACRRSSLPVVAIGGIGFEQVAAVFEAGAASAALISALMTSPRIASAMERLLRCAESFHSRRPLRGSTGTDTI